jgi:choline-sulfatase
MASRSMLMSGMQLWQARKVSKKFGNMAKANQMWPQRMKAQGYTTYFSGKWHTGPHKLAEQVFDHAEHVRGGMPNQSKDRYSRTFEPGKTSSWLPTDKSKGGFWKGGKHWSEILADDAASFMKMAAKDKKPFFMMCSFNAPHDPRQAPQKYQDMYPYGNIKVPDSFMPLYPDDIGSNKIRDEQLAPFPRTKFSVQVNRSEYYALITHTDEQIGKILNALEKSGKADNTVIIFTADHGLSVGAHGLIGKQNQYDCSVRAPWIITGPGIPKGKKVNDKIYLQAAMTTALDLAGADISKDAFKSAVKIISGEDKGHDTVYGAYIDFQRMARNDKYKLIWYPQIGVEKLFDMQKDPEEIKDLSKSPEFKKVVVTMRKKLAAKMKEMGDKPELISKLQSRFSK